VLPAALRAQELPPHAAVPIRWPLITRPIDESRRTKLKGNTHPLARPIYDVGSAPDTLIMRRMLLVLKRGRDQEAALGRFLEDQQTRYSANYHQWLTPEQFDSQFGPSEMDTHIVTSWLQSHGFEIADRPNGTTVIEFSGSAGQVKEAFHTEIHKYVVSEEQHWANAGDPEIPSALTPVIAGVVSLHDFGRKALHRVVGAFASERGEQKFLPPLLGSEGPLIASGGGCPPFDIPCNAIGPADFATIYDVHPLWNATPPIDGTGQIIAIVGQSDIYPQDFSNFRRYFGLPPATLNIIYNGSPPAKLASQGDELESDLDVEWSGAVAKGATIDLVASTTTNSTAGVDLSALYIVDNNLAPVMSDSYGACELEMGSAANLFYSQLWQQAAAQGITVFVSTGDSGSAVCDWGASLAVHGLSVNGISSTPYNVAVGGTDFDDAQNSSQYWNTNTSVTAGSAKGYVPEMTWNDTCTNSEFFAITAKSNAESDCNAYNSPYWPSFVPPVGGSGGASNCITSDGQSLSSCSGGYAKPSWQNGPGVPNDGVRDVPDISLFAGDGINGSAYLVCETDIYGGCPNAGGQLIRVGGTSAAAPTLAAIMAMVVQATQSRQGNANYIFYPFAAEPGASCNSAGSVTNSCIFHDVTVGTIAMGCMPGSANCVTEVVGDQVGVLTGYDTTTGFDLATGLGSVDAANLANNWAAVSFQPTTSSLSLSPTNQITHGSPVNVSINVTPAAGSGVPTGQVSLVTSQGLPAGSFTLANGAVAANTSLLPGGSYTVSAHYAGDGTFAASNSSPGIPVIVSAEPSTTTVQAFSLDQNGNKVPFTTGPYGGDVVYLSADVAGKSGQGVATGTVNLTQSLNGTSSPFSGNPYRLNSQALTIVPMPGYNYWAYAPGTYTMAATYSGDNSFKASSTPGVTFTVTKAQTNVSTNILGCTPSSTPCQFGANNTIQIAATVNYSGAAFNMGGVFINQPTGTITFYSNGTPLGAPVAVDSSIAPPGAGINVQMPLGLESVTAQYSGDADFGGSTSPTTLIDIGGSFSITANPTTINIATPGQSGSTTLTFSAQNGLTGSFQLSPSICLSLPAQSTCSFTPPILNFSSSTTAIPVTLTIATTGSSSKALSSHVASTTGGATWGMAGFAVLGFFVIPLALRRSHWQTFTVFIALVAIATAVACGGGGSSGTGAGAGGGNGGAVTGTPPGTYNLALEFDIGGPVQIIYVKVVVQ
jgi:pro-kumamolisin-like protein/Big-like domain-containing protein